MNSLKREQVEVEVVCDTERLYGTLSEAIKYLQEVENKYPNAYLDEHWTGYEDMEMRFVYYREESDEEYNRRVDLEESRKDRAGREAAKKKEQDEIAKEIERLKNKSAKLGWA